MDDEKGGKMKAMLAHYIKSWSLEVETKVSKADNNYSVMYHCPKFEPVRGAHPRPQPLYIPQ